MDSEIALPAGTAGTTIATRLAATPEVAAEVLHPVVEFETLSGTFSLWVSHQGSPPSLRLPSCGG
ncbi:hypothetical protein ACH4A7_03855 [Streptomyces cyaneofuscatus]|uniref:hypothetical protein n=1 Tax=Streptomyces cyaneofuscatus TaxID=66883 RepID=UPI003795DBE7